MTINNETRQKASYGITTVQVLEIRALKHIEQNRLTKQINSCYKLESTTIIYEAEKQIKGMDINLNNN